VNKAVLCLLRMPKSKLLVAVCCGLLQSYASCACQSLNCLLQCVAVCCSLMPLAHAKVYTVVMVECRSNGIHDWQLWQVAFGKECVAVCCSVLQCVAVCCSVLHVTYGKDAKYHLYASYFDFLVEILLRCC